VHYWSAAETDEFVQTSRAIHWLKEQNSAYGEAGILGNLLPSAKACTNAALVNPAPSQ